MSRTKCDVYRSNPLVLSGTGVEFTQTCFRKKPLNYALSCDFEICKGVWFTAVYKKNESATTIRARTILKGGWYLKVETLNPKTFESGEFCRVNDFLSNPDIFLSAIFWVCGRTKMNCRSSNGIDGVTFAAKLMANSVVAVAGCLILLQVVVIYNG